MTTYTQYVQAPNALFQFEPTLDGVTYTAMVTWNTAGQRLYLNVISQDGSLVFALPLIGSPTGFTIQDLTWTNGTATLETNIPHGYEIGTTLELTVSNCTPEAFNGIYEMLVVDPVTLTYPIAANPGDALTLGQVDFNINIAGGYFSSVLVFREANQQFEVNP